MAIILYYDSKGAVSCIVYHIISSVTCAPYMVMVIIFLKRQQVATMGEKGVRTRTRKG